ncbi:MAG TPA: alpha/beta fold hydrolase [Pseudonocardiaceae bacterium]
MAERMVQVGDVQLWTEELGDPTAPPLLLIMGANTSAMGWPDELVTLLVDGGLRVIRYDHRDTGRSTRRDFAAHPYSVADLAEDALGVLDAYGIEAAHVLGLSLGGTIGQLLALDHRERLLTLTVTMTCALDVDFAGNWMRALAGEPSPDDLPTPEPAVVRAVTAARAEPATDRETELEQRVAVWRALAGTALPFDPEEFRRWEERDIDHSGTLQPPTAHSLATPVPRERGAELTGVTTPTLVIQGMEDPLNPPPHGQHLADLIPTARLVEIPGMGHALSGPVHQPFAEAVLTHVHQYRYGNR